MCMMKKSIKHCVLLHSYTPSELYHIADDISRDCTACVFVYNPTELMSRKAWRIAPALLVAALHWFALHLQFHWITLLLNWLHCITIIIFRLTSNWEHSAGSRSAAWLTTPTHSNLACSFQMNYWTSTHSVSHLIHEIIWPSKTLWFWESGIGSGFPQNKIFCRNLQSPGSHQ